MRVRDHRTYGEPHFEHSLMAFILSNTQREELRADSMFSRISPRCRVVYSTLDYSPPSMYAASPRGLWLRQSGRPSMPVPARADRANRAWNAFGWVQDLAGTVAKLKHGAYGERCYKIRNPRYSQYEGRRGLFERKRSVATAR